MVPPTPGPLAAAANLHAEVGLVILIGLIIAIPTMLAGYFWSRRFNAHFDPGQHFTGDEHPDAAWENLKKSYPRLPSAWAAFMPLVLPILLIAAASFATQKQRPAPVSPAAATAPSTAPAIPPPTTQAAPSPIRRTIQFLGTPITALLIGIIACLPLVRGRMSTALGDWISIALKDAAIILVVTGAGGSLGKMLAATHVSDYLGSTLSHWRLGVFLPFIIAAAIKTAQGSSTVALITTSAIIAPMAESLGLGSDFGRALLVAAVAAGSMVASHANDSYFWVVSQFSHMEVSTAYRAQTTATIVQGLAGIATVALLSLFA